MRSGVISLGSCLISCREKKEMQTQREREREAVPPPRRFDPRYYRERALATLLETIHPLATTDCDVRIDPGALEIVTTRANAPLERPRLNSTLRPSNCISIHSVDHRWLSLIQLLRDENLISGIKYFSRGIFVLGDRLTV